MLKIILQFVVSGTIVVLATYLSNKVGQKWAGLLVAAPLLTLITFVFISIEDNTRNYREYLGSALIFMIPAAIFIACLLLFSDKLHFIPNIIISLLIYSLAVLTINALG